MTPPFAIRCVLRMTRGLLLGSCRLPEGAFEMLAIHSSGTVRQDRFVPAYSDAREDGRNTRLQYGDKAFPNAGRALGGRNLPPQRPCTVRCAKPWYTKLLGTNGILLD